MSKKLSDAVNNLKKIANNDVPEIKASIDALFNGKTQFYSIGSDRNPNNYISIFSNIKKSAEAHVRDTFYDSFISDLNIFENHVIEFSVLAKEIWELYNEKPRTNEKYNKLNKLVTQVKNYTDLQKYDTKPNGYLESLPGKYLLYMKKPEYIDEDIRDTNKEKSYWYVYLIIIGLIIFTLGLFLFVYVVFVFNAMKHRKLLGAGPSPWLGPAYFMIIDN